MCLIVLYYIIWSILILRAPDLMAEQRRAHLRAAVGALALVVPLLTFEVSILYFNPLTCHFSAFAFHVPHCVRYTVQCIYLIDIQLEHLFF